MPKLNRELIRTWLEDHNWTVARLTAECNLLGEDTFAEGTMRNAVNGIDPVRPGRIKVICRVLAKYGDGVPYERLVETTDGRTDVASSRRVVLDQRQGVDLQPPGDLL